MADLRSNSRRGNIDKAGILQRRFAGTGIASVLAKMSEEAGWRTTTNAKKTQNGSKCTKGQYRTPAHQSPGKSKLWRSQRRRSSWASLPSDIDRDAIVQDRRIENTYCCPNIPPTQHKPSAMTSCAQVKNRGYGKLLERTCLFKKTMDRDIRK